MSASGAVTPPARRARPAEAKQMAALLMDGLGEKFRPALGRDGGARLAKVIDAEIGGGDSYFVVVDEQGVTGVAHLDLGNERASTTFQGMARVLGWPRTIRALAAWSLIEARRRQPGEAYVDELVVADRARRKGVGKALLAACESEAHESGLDWLRLIVVWDNEPAIALYRSVGYRVAARRRWYLGRLVFGSPGALLMEKRLERQGDASASAPSPSEGS